MSKIKYEFCDGTVQEVEVSDEIYALHEQLLQAEKRNHWKETRRHVSLNYLNELGVDFEDSGADTLDKLIRKEDNERIHNALIGLSNKQRELVEKVFFDNMSLREIAKESDISHQALSKQMATIYKKLKNFFEKGCHTPVFVLIGRGVKSAY